MYNKLKMLDIKNIAPEGWLLDQLEIQSQGLSKKLFYAWDSTGSYSGWLGGTGEDWERGPYYIDGLLPLAHYTNDQELLGICHQFLDWTLKSQDEAGNFGPGSSKSDWWSRVVMLKALIQYYEISKQSRIITFISRYFTYMDQNLLKNPIVQWGSARTADLLYCIFWLEDRQPLACKDSLIEKILSQSLDWCDFQVNFPFTRPTAYYYDWAELYKEKTDRIPSLMQYHATHIVNVAMGLKFPAMLYTLTGEKAYSSVLKEGIKNLTKYHGVASGVFNGDEHLSGANPTQGAELCSVVEYMFSMELALESFGESYYADLLEKVAYNALPATITEDFMAHQYLQQINQVEASTKKRNWYNNKEDANTFGLEPHFGCCTANMHQGWPKLVRSLWYTDDQENLHKMTYAPCRVTTTIAGKSVSLREKTEYPFRETVSIYVEEADQEFTMFLRIPGWCTEPQITFNGEVQNLPVKAGKVALKQHFKTGDVVELTFPMTIRLERWYNQSAAILRGPLLFSLALNEDWHITKTVGGINDYDVTTTSDWNLALTQAMPSQVKEEPLGKVPFSRQTPAVRLTMPATVLPNWKRTENGGNTEEIPASPVKGSNQVVEAELIPFGCTKLRIGQFPTTFSEEME